MESCLIAAAGGHQGTCSQAFERAKMHRPDLYYWIVARVAHTLRDRLRYAARYAGVKNISYPDGAIGNKGDGNAWSISRKN